MDREQCRPWRQIRLLQAEHLRGKDPGDDGGQNSLEQLRHTGPHDRVAQTIPQRCKHGHTPSYPLPRSPGQNGTRRHNSDATDTTVIPHFAA